MSLLIYLSGYAYWPEIKVGFNNPSFSMSVFYVISQTYFLVPYITASQFISFLIASLYLIMLYFLAESSNLYVLKYLVSVCTEEQKQ